MSLCLISVPKLIHAFPHSPIIAVFVCCHFTSYLSTFCQLHVHTIRLLPIFHKYQTNPIDPHSSWLHSGKLVCLQAISQPLVSWQKSYAYSGIVSHKKNNIKKVFSGCKLYPYICRLLPIFPYIPPLKMPVNSPVPRKTPSFQEKHRPHWCLASSCLSFLPLPPRPGLAWRVFVGSHGGYNQYFMSKIVQMCYVCAYVYAYLHLIIYVYIHSYADTTNCTIANKPGTGNPTRKIVCNASEHNLIHKHRNGPKCKYINHLCISDMERNQVLFGSFNQKFIGVGG